MSPEQLVPPSSTVPASNPHSPQHQQPHDVFGIHALFTPIVVHLVYISVHTMGQLYSFLCPGLAPFIIPGFTQFHGGSVGKRPSHHRHPICDSVENVAEVLVRIEDDDDDVRDYDAEEEDEDEQELQDMSIRKSSSIYSMRDFIEEGLKRRESERKETADRREREEREQLVGEGNNNEEQQGPQLLKPSVMKKVVLVIKVSNLLLCSHQNLLSLQSNSK